MNRLLRPIVALTAAIASPYAFGQSQPKEHSGPAMDHAKKFASNIVKSQTREIDDWLKTHGGPKK